MSTKPRERTPAMPERLNARTPDADYGFLAALNAAAAYNRRDWVPNPTYRGPAPQPPRRAMAPAAQHAAQHTSPSLLLGMPTEWGAPNPPIPTQAASVTMAESPCGVSHSGSSWTAVNDLSSPTAVIDLTAPQPLRPLRPREPAAVHAGDVGMRAEESPHATSNYPVGVPRYPLSFPPPRNTPILDWQTFHAHEMLTTRGRDINAMTPHMDNLLREWMRSLCRGQ